jgi:BlaI family transcriptional regulator, penicillinase repressor
MPRPPKSILTDWETKLMHIIWENDNTSADDIREQLRSENIKRSDSAIRKTLRVMEEKGYIHHTIHNRTYLYKPSIPKKEVERDAIKYISNLFFKNSPGTLAMRALDESELTPELVEQMKKKLEEFES